MRYAPSSTLLPLLSRRGAASTRTSNCSSTIHNLAPLKTSARVQQLSLIFTLLVTFIRTPEEEDVKSTDRRPCRIRPRRLDARARQPHYIASLGWRNHPAGLRRLSRPACCYQSHSHSTKKTIPHLYSQTSSTSTSNNGHVSPSDLQRQSLSLGPPRTPRSATPDSRELNKINKILTNATATSPGTRVSLALSAATSASRRVLPSGSLASPPLASPPSPSPSSSTSSILVSRPTDWTATTFVSVLTRTLVSLPRTERRTSGVLLR